MTAAATRATDLSSTFFGAGVLRTLPALPVARETGPAQIPALFLPGLNVNAPSLGRPNALDLKFPDKSLEHTYREWVWARRALPVRLSAVALSIAVVALNVLNSAIHGRALDLAMLWPAGTAAVLLAVWSILTSSASRNRVHHWSAVATAAYTLLAALALTERWLCSAIVPVTSPNACPPSPGPDVPHLVVPYVVGTTVPLILHSLLAARALHVFESAVFLLAIEIVTLTVGRDWKKLDVATSCIFIIIFDTMLTLAVIMASFYAEAADRLVFLSHMALQDAASACGEKMSTESELAHGFEARGDLLFTAEGRLVEEATTERPRAEEKAPDGVNPRNNTSSIILDVTTANSAACRRWPLSAVRSPPEPQSLSPPSLLPPQPPSLSTSPMLASFFDGVHHDDVADLSAAVSEAVMKLPKSTIGEASEAAAIVCFIARYRRRMLRQSPSPAVAPPQLPPPLPLPLQALHPLSQLPQLPLPPSAAAASTAAQCAAGDSAPASEEWVSLIAFARRTGAPQAALRFHAVGCEVAVGQEVAEDVRRARAFAGRAGVTAGLDASSKALAWAAHELRGPAHNVAAMLELLARRSELTTTLQKDIQLAARAAADLRDLSTDLLDIRASHAATASSRVRVRATLGVEVRQLVAALAQTSAAAAAVPIVLDIDDRLPRCVTTDKRLLYQALSNGLSNAAKLTYTGCITVRVEWLEAATAQSVPPLASATEQPFSTQRKVLDNATRLPAVTSRIRFEIIDTGVGLGDVAPESLFGERVMGPSSAVSSLEGSGLGLFIARRIAHALDGEVALCEEARSVPNAFDSSAYIVSPAISVRALRIPSIEPSGEDLLPPCALVAAYGSGDELHVVGMGKLPSRINIPVCSGGRPPPLSRTIALANLSSACPYEPYCPPPPITSLVFIPNGIAASVDHPSGRSMGKDDVWTRHTSGRPSCGHFGS